VRKEPVRWVTVGVTTVLAILSTLMGTGVLSPQVAAVVAAVVAGLTVVAGELARMQVTPLADPKTNDGTSLVPLGYR